MKRVIFLLIFACLCISTSFLQACEPEKKVKSELKIPEKLNFNLWVPVINRDTTTERMVATKEVNNFLKNKKNLEARNQYGKTPLLIAASIFKGIDLVKHLLDMGANVEAKDNFTNSITGEEGNTPLSVAIYNRDPETVKILLEYGAKVNPKYLKFAQNRHWYYSTEKNRSGLEHKAEGFRKILDLPAFKQLHKILTIEQETGIPKDVIESIILPYETRINIKS